MLFLSLTSRVTLHAIHTGFHTVFHTANVVIDAAVTGYQCQVSIARFEVTISVVNISTWSVMNDTSTLLVWTLFCYLKG